MVTERSTLKHSHKISASTPPDFRSISSLDTYSLELITTWSLFVEDLTVPLCSIWECDSPWMFIMDIRFWLRLTISMHSALELVILVSMALASNFKLTRLFSSSLISYLQQLKHLNHFHSLGCLSWVHFKILGLQMNTKKMKKPLIMLRPPRTLRKTSKWKLQCSMLVWSPCNSTWIHSESQVIPMIRKSLVKSTSCSLVSLLKLLLLTLTAVFKTWVPRNVDWNK